MIFKIHLKNQSWCKLPSKVQPEVAVDLEDRTQTLLTCCRRFWLLTWALQHLNQSMNMQGVDSLLLTAAETGQGRFILTFGLQLVELIKAKVPHLVGKAAPERLL